MKECVKQLRTGREEQEQKQEEFSKTSGDWETLRAELEAKLSKAEAGASEHSSRAETLEQRIHSLTEAKFQAELDAKKVSTRVEGLEKENSTLKHDVRALKKDLVNLNNESKKASELSKQQLAESSRKVLKLEAECQKLKTQLRKKSSTRLEGDVLERRKSLGKLVSSPRAFSVDSVDDCSEMGTREIDDKWFTMEEELKALKDEVLKKRKELEMARIMCSRVASRLRSFEEQLENSGAGVSIARYIDHLKAFGSNQGLNLGSEPDDEADARALALIEEMAMGKEEEKKPDKLLDTTSFELMDDFLEMEKLTSNINGLPKQQEKGLSNGDSHKVEAKVEPGLISRIIRSIEVLAESIGLNRGDSPGLTGEEGLVSPRLSWLDPGINSGFQRLASSGSSLLQGRSDFVSFAGEVAGLLEILTSSAQTREDQELVESLRRENEALGSQLSSLSSLEAEKVALDESVKKTTSELEKLKLKNRELEEELEEKNTIIEQLRSSISILEDDVNAAEERAHSTVKGLSATFEEDLEREKSEREASQRSIEAMNIVMAELQAQKSSLEEDSKSLAKKLSALEEELKRERSEKLAAQRDIDGVNEEIQKLMGEFVQLQHEKQGLEAALEDAKVSSQASYTGEFARLQEKLRSSLQQEEQSKTMAQEMKVELERFVKREEALQRSVSERDSKQIEMLVRIEKMKEEKAQLIARVEDLEQRLSAISDLLRVEQSRVNGLREENGRLELQNVTLEGGVYDSEEKMREMQVSFRSLQDEFYQAKIEKEEVEQNYFMAEQKLQEECRRLRDENSRIQEGLKGEFDRSDRELRATSSENERLLSELDELRVELSALRASNEELEQKLGNSIAECSELDAEKRDLEQLLAATNEIVQGIKEECSRLSDVEEKLGLEKQGLEKELAGAEEKLKEISQELKALEGDKAELEHDLALSQVTWKSQVFEADEVVASLRAELALSAKSKQLAEEQLAESFNSKAELQYQVKAAEHEASQLSEKVKALEEERERLEDEINELRLQLITRVEDNKEVTQVDEVQASDKNLELSAKLDECHRAILTLGEQLQALSSSRNSSPPSPPEPSNSGSEESISTAKASGAEEKPHQQQQLQQEVDLPSAAELNEIGVIDGKVFVPSLPLEGRPRSKSTSPAKPKISKSSSASKELDFSKSIDLSSSPSEKPSSSSGFSRFFRGKSSHH